MAEETKNYQLAAFISPILDEKQVKEIVEKVKKLVLDNGGKTTDQKISKKSLGYKIKHFQDAFYVLLNIDLLPEKVTDLNAKLKLENDILRFMITISSPLRKEKKPTAKPLGKALKPDIVDQFISKEPMPLEPDPKKDKQPEPKAAKEEKEKVDLADLDKKLDEILNE